MTKRFFCLNLWKQIYREHNLLIILRALCKSHIGCLSANSRGRAKVSKGDILKGQRSTEGLTEDGFRISSTFVSTLVVTVK
jgi:hypothetical protein